MEEYRLNGVRLGLLINPKNKQVEIYRPGQEPEILESPTSIDCGEVMPGFILSMSEIWRSYFEGCRTAARFSRVW
jgi:Uma2 family endonuclease